MNTTDLLLQMTLAATQIAQNTTPPVSGRTEDAGDRRDFSTLLAEKRVEAAGTETGRAVPESQKGEVPAAADGGALSQGAQSVPQAPGLEELFRSLLMGAQAAPEGDASLQQVPQTAVPGMAQAPAAAEEGAVLLQPGQQTAGGEQLPVPAEPALAGEAESTVQTEVLPAAEDGGTATAQAVTPAARESGAQTPADAGETAGRPARGEQELPELDSVQTEGAAQPLFDRTEHMPVKVGEADTLDATEPDFAPRLAKAITEAEQEGARHVELKLAPEHLGKLSVELTQGKDGVLHIVFHAENEQAMKLLQEHSATLVSMLHGSHSGEIQVEVPRPQQGEQPWQQPEQQPGQQHGRNPQEQGRQRQSTEDFLQQLRLGLLGVEAE
ncbi:flagellar hook-length control protein FliK [Flavonifractor plautii]|jgi:flagellar hook-length control protein FliK|uniref:flagellar hook-length control protein FliK n=1 Tax=Flavonifractor plautii TaxID=292800 RepID=UPI0018AA37C8|nr:flagellar hook-length control protein FliK [Flavonifractor plautii]MDB7923737.1 flagellar hook-length control protein FliK [Flavonifractor plautii]